MWYRRQPRRRRQVALIDSTLDINRLIKFSSYRLDLKNIDPEALLEVMQQLLDKMESEEEINRDENNIGSQSNKVVGKMNENSDLLDSVVRIYCTHSEPNFAMPWQRMKQEFSTSTGFVIDNKHKRILTNAHSVEYGALVQVKKRQSENKYVASVLAVGHECDLALLCVEDESFWEDLDSLKFGELPDLFEDVSVIGYPVGGDSISISSGVVSRIEMQEYAQASAELLAIQIDAAINPGNSGGPVVNSEDLVIGVAFQSLSQEEIENIGYVVPVNVINHFLEDVEKHGKYSGVCGLGVRLQGMENEDLRKFYNLKAGETGVLILSSAPLAPSAKVLQKGDVILEIDGVRVANDGTIPFRKGSLKERVQLSYYITQKFAGERVVLSILRDGLRMQVPVALWIPEKLVPRVLCQRSDISLNDHIGTGSKGSIVGGFPSFLMIGGLVMIALSREYLDVEFNPESMTDFDQWSEEYKLLGDADTTRKYEDEEVVLLSQVISHTCNIGYEMQRNTRLLAFNGIQVKNLKHLNSLIIAAGRKQSADALGSVRLPFVFEFAAGQVIVLDGIAALAAQEQICKEHFIPSACSADLLQE
jgi:S1-C subfamily serine protease